MPEDLTYGDLPPNVQAYLSRPGVNREKALQWFSLGISEPQTYNQAKLLAEAVGNSPEQAKVVAGQWQFESGGGVHMGANHNYFGIQAHTQAVRDRLIARGINVGVGDLTDTPEVRNGKTVTTKNKFMEFDNAFDGFQAHRVFLETNPIYEGALAAKTAKDFAKGLEKAGYATATNYGTTLYNNYVLPKEKSPLSGDTRPKSFGPTTSKVKLGTSKAGQTPEIVPALPTKPLELIETNTLGVRPEISTSPAQADYIPTNSAPVVIPASEAMQMSAPKGWFGSGKSTFNAMGGSLNNSGFHALPKEVQNKIRTNMNNKRFEAGGPMGQLTEFNSGGSHEESPLGGIPQGQAPDGGTNLVEQGETKLNAADYIFSKTLKIDKETAQEFNLKPNFVGKDFAEASKIANRKDSRRENDTIETNAIQRDLDNLMNAQEAFKQKAVEKKLAEIQALDPNALEQIAQSYQPQGMPPQGMEQGMPQGQPSPEEMMMMQQQGQGQGQPPMDPAMMQQMMAQQQGAPQMPMQYGGPMSYKCGGGMYDYGGHLMDNHSYKFGGAQAAQIGGQVLSTFGSLAGSIPGVGTAVGIAAGGLGKGLTEIGNQKAAGVDDIGWGEVAKKTALGAASGALGPVGAVALGAADKALETTYEDPIEKQRKKDALALSQNPNDPTLLAEAEDRAKQSATAGMINQGIGAIGGAVGNSLENNAATPVAPTATPAPAMPAMPVNDAMMMPTATTMPVPEWPETTRKYGGNMFAVGGTMPGSNFGNYPANTQTNFANNAGPMGQPLTNVYAMGGMFDGPGDPPVTAAATHPLSFTQQSYKSSTGKTVPYAELPWTEKVAVNRGAGFSAAMDAEGNLVYTPSSPASMGWFFDENQSSLDFNRYQEFSDSGKTSDDINGVRDTRVGSGEKATHIFDPVSQTNKYTKRTGKSWDHPDTPRIIPGDYSIVLNPDYSVKSQGAKYTGKWENMEPKVINNQNTTTFAMGGNMNHYFDPGGGLQRDIFGNIIPYKPSLQIPTMINPWTQNNGLRSSLGLSNENYNNKSLDTPIEGFKTGQDTVKSNYENREGLGAFAANMAPIAYNAYQGFLAKQMPLPENMAAQYDPYLQNVNPQLRAAQEEAAHAYAALRNMGNPGAVAANLGNISHQNALARAEILAAKENADNLSKTEAAKYNNKNKVDAKLMKWQLEAQMKNAKAEAQKEAITGIKDYSNMQTQNALASDYNAMAGEGNYTYENIPYLQGLQRTFATSQAARNKKKEDNKKV